MKLFIAFLFVTAAFSSFSQVPVKLSLKFHNAGQEMQMGQQLTALNGVSYVVSDLGFYISYVKIVHDGGQETAIDSVYLFKNDRREIVLDNIALTNVEGIKFMVGVPAVVNHLDISQYPEDHPLSYQTPPMHWGWSSGYMHFIMNAYGDGNNDGQADPGHLFQLHCLGDNNTPSVSVTTIANVHPDNTREIVLFVNIDQWIEGSNPATTGIMHGSTGINHDVMDNVEENPVFVAPENAGLTENQNSTLVNVFQNGKDAVISWDNSIAASSYDLLGPDGRIFETGKCASGSLSFSQMNTGLHFIRLYGPKNSLLGSAKWIVP